MDPKAQHRHNAGLERRWMADAARDQRDSDIAAQREASRGHLVEAHFLAEESKNAGSWLGKREGILRREERLGR